MRFVTTICCILILSVGHSQIPNIKRIDSIVSTIESKKALTLKVVSDTFPTVNPDVVTIESVRFHSAKNKLVKAIFSSYYYNKGPAKSNILAQYEVFYFYNDSLIKAISKDFDLSPPKDFQYYLNEKHLKKYVSKETINASRYDGVNYFVELGYNLLTEFKSLNQK